MCDGMLRGDMVVSKWRFTFSGEIFPEMVAVVKEKKNGGGCVQCVF